ncbi:MAG: endonuclease domain-containing protein [Proteobacteria bacterium]|nr:MAG: endonuclease domain-containing protein [Pseudomonadota bacterium]
MRKIIPYNPKIKELARQLRNQSTKSEIKLWQFLKGKQLKGYRFIRQKPLLNYIADFYCYDLKLVIELDGYTHDFEEGQNRDIQKQKELEDVGLMVVHFTDKDVMDNIEGVLTHLMRVIIDIEESSR